MAPPLVWINGFPGSGKLTIAKALEELMGPDRVVVDNIQLLSPLEAVRSRANPEYERYRSMYRSRALDRLTVDPSMSDKLVVYTDFQLYDHNGAAAAAEYQSAALRSYRTFLSVVISLAPPENLKRLRSQETGEGSPRKIAEQATMLGSLRDEGSLFRFGGNEELELDVTDLLPEEAAHYILGHVAAHT
ncbi:hypothetical protein K402DRAFT_418985 [Aulographum hederae CBS 113979]|uniref:P-loop containing nucleoside triphosphate hydrolase protein n=1 Tax=Aulographum hederae CBS 113979 TaxID=1176131 RepID=A0A6G1H7G2_9PEZI|nr:hypothetical protein K402DRAFT_418985 [Aulographum hederae CBS 113979]